MYVDEPAAADLSTCMGGACRPGDEYYLVFYEVWNDDQQGMRACSQNVAIDWHICYYDARLPEYIPTPPTVASLGFLNVTAGH